MPSTRSHLYVSWDSVDVFEAGDMSSAYICRSYCSQLPSIPESQLDYQFRHAGSFLPVRTPYDHSPWRFTEEGRAAVVPNIFNRVGLRFSRSWARWWHWETWALQQRVRSRFHRGGEHVVLFFISSAWRGSFEVTTIHKTFWWSPAQGSPGVEGSWRQVSSRILEFRARAQSSQSLLFSWWNVVAFSLLCCFRFLGYPLLLKYMNPTSMVTNLNCNLSLKCNIEISLANASVNDASNIWCTRTDNLLARRTG